MGMIRLLALLALAGVATAVAAADARFAWFHYAGSDPVDATLAQAPGQYRNPIIAGFYPDPSIERVGEDYYMVHSTFSWFPGLPVWHSRDLVNWTQIGNAIDRTDQIDLAGRELSQGLYAPAISYHKGLFYIVNTCLACGGNFVITAKHPKGPWSRPTWFPELGWGIDPSLFFDTDGTAWLLNNASPEGDKEEYEGHRAIFIQRLDLDTLKLVGRRTMIVNGGVDIRTKPIWIEGPHIFRRGDHYYLTAAEGGTGDQHSQVIFRASHPEGPWTPWDRNPILTQRDLPADRPFPITSTGHADPVLTQNGDWWVPFLATRPYRGNQYNTGRETFLLPMRWTADGWPIILEPGVAVPHVADRPRLPQGAPPPIPTSGPFTVHEDFTGDAIAPHWMMMRTPKESWHRLADGALHLRPRTDLLGTLSNPSFLARRQQHHTMEASTLVSFTPEGREAAGLAILQRDEFWFALLLVNNNGRREIRLMERAGAADPPAGRVIARAAAPDGPVRLRIGGEGARYWFDYAPESGPWRRLLDNADGTILSTDRAGGFVGAMVGPYAAILP